MIGLQQGLAGGGVEGEEGQGGDEGRGAASGQADALAPGRASRAVCVGVAVAGAGDEINALAQAVTVVLHDDGEAVRERGDVRAAATARQAHGGLLPVADQRGVQVAVAIHFRAADEAQVDLARRHQAHQVDHACGPERAADVGGVAHRVEQFGGGRVAHDADFEEADGVGRVCALRQREGDERQAHTHKDVFSILYLPCGADNHQFFRGIFHVGLSPNNRSPPGRQTGVL